MKKILESGKKYFNKQISTSNIYIYIFEILIIFIKKSPNGVKYQFNENNTIQCVWPDHNIILDENYVCRFDKKDIRMFTLFNVNLDK